MKKKTRFLVTIFLILTMTFGSVLTVSAQETPSTFSNTVSAQETPSTFSNDATWDKLLSLCGFGSKFEYEIDISKTEFPNKTRYSYFKSDVPIYAIILKLPSFTRNRSLFKAIYFSESPYDAFTYSNYFRDDDYSHVPEYNNEFELREYSFLDKKLYRFGFSPSLDDEHFVIRSDIPICTITNWNDYVVNYSNFDLKELYQYLSDGNNPELENKSPVVDNSLFLKNVGYSVRAENSSEYPDETFIKFTWDIDNLQSGDLLEIRTRNHYTKIGGDKVIGFHDYITAKDFVNCFNGSYEMSQTDAVKAWFATVEGKPLVFKDYDTDMYFLRPVRGNQLGLWVRVTMGRKTPTSSPYVEDIEYGDFSPDGDWIKNDDVTIGQGGNHGIDQGGNVIAPDDIENIVKLESIGDLFKYLFSNLKLLIGYFGEIPFLINSVMGWMPTPIIILICAFIAIVILLRIFGR